MNAPTTYEIVMEGRPGERLLRPLVDDFTARVDIDGRLVLTGVVRDASHLHGIVAHLSSVNVEIVRVAPLPGENPPSADRPVDQRRKLP